MIKYREMLRHLITLSPAALLVFHRRTNDAWYAGRISRAHFYTVTGFICVRWRQINTELDLPF